jgi:hypothetical protein
VCTDASGSMVVTSVVITSGARIATTHLPIVATYKLTVPRRGAPFGRRPSCAGLRWWRRLHWRKFEPIGARIDVGLLYIAIQSVTIANRLISLATRAHNRSSSVPHVGISYT